MEKLTHLSLFSGIGGLDLAAEWAGFETVGQCEWKDYQNKILEKHWPNVPRWRDIRELSANDFIRRTGIRAGELTIISGGFPCQPFSVAGNQKGKEDERYLWPEMYRIIRELHPAYILGENVPGILHIAADDVCKDMEREGYEVGIFNYEAAAVGAPHRRDRFFFVAHSRGIRCHARGDNRETGHFQNNPKWDIQKNKQEGNKRFDRAGEIGADLAHSNNKGLEIAGLKPGEQKTIKENRTQYSSCDGSNTHSKRLQGGKESGDIEKCGKETNELIAGLHSKQGGWWEAEPELGRVANGIPDRVDRLQCLGNAVVPYQVYPIFKAIAELEKGI